MSSLIEGPVVECCNNGLHFVSASLHQFPWSVPSHTDSELGYVHLLWPMKLSKCDTNKDLNVNTGA